MTALGGNQLKTTLLLVEDEAALADSLTTEFELENMSVIWAKDGAEALTLFKNNEGKINVIILDWMLPKLDGFSVLRKIRQSSRVPIIMLTARDYIGDKVAGLTGGADDYITKPFEMEELVARVEVALRHNRQAVSPATIFQVDDLLVDTDNKRVQRGEVIMPLTQREYELLVELVAHQDEACSRDDLLAAVWEPILTVNLIYWMSISETYVIKLMIIQVARNSFILFAASAICSRLMLHPFSEAMID